MQALTLLVTTVEATHESALALEALQAMIIDTVYSNKNIYILKM
jgi:hypothetical protein